MDPIEPFRNEAERILSRILMSHEIDIQPVFSDAPEGYGDIAFPCFPLARNLKISPVQIAENFAEQSKKIMEDEGEQFISHVDALNGFLNFTFDPAKLIERTMATIQDMKVDYGLGKKKEVSIILEHTSANPNGPFHVGRARNPIIGDTLGRILRCAGYDVTTEYYVNDMGKQAVILAWGVENREHLTMKSMGIEEDGETEEDTQKDDHILVGHYQRASSLMNEDESVLEEINSMVERYENGDREIGKKVSHFCNLVLEGMKETLMDMNITLDNYVYESRFVYDGTVTEIIEKLGGSQFSMEDDGAMFLELESFGVKGRNTRFFYTRKGGTSLYTTRDLAYHMNKFERADRVIDILGEDHKLKTLQLGIALGELGEERRPEVVFYAFVSLPEGKMSTRRGRVVYLDNLIQEALDRAYIEVDKRRPELPENDKRSISRQVGIGAIRYNIERVQMEKSIVFKWEEALNFEGDSAPFIQYAHARACSILRKAGESVTGDTAPYLSLTGADIAGTLIHDQERALIRLLAGFPDMIQECAGGLKIHPLASYVRDMAQQFNQFYRECPVLTVDEETMNARLCLVNAFRIVVASGLELLGIDAPEYM